jgi:hypothetical protein
MKTQLLEDFDESGSAPSGRQPHVGVPPHPAVWQRGRHEEERVPAEAAAPAVPDTARNTSAPVRQSAVRPAAADLARTEPLHVQPDTARNASAPVGHPTARPAAASGERTEPLRVQTQGFAPQPAVLGGGEPDWLAAHLARDAALNERSEWSGRWTQRLAAWGAAGVLLALLAGGGLWLYEQSQVDGALVVVANTNPAPGGGATRSGIGIGTGTGTGHPAPGLPAVAPVSSSVPTPAAAAAPPTVADLHNTRGVGAVGGLGGANNVESVPAESPVQAETGNDARSVVSVNLAEPDATQPAPKRQRSHARKHPKAETSAAIQDNEPSARQRREETQMQCRAHGYDERQCLQRGCEMTRFGFACKG